ncbi:MAG: hypothetical protein ACTS6A_00500 [Candidatus Hodgkinia cicadicola]
MIPTTRKVNLSFRRRWMKRLMKAVEMERNVLRRRGNGDEPSVYEYENFAEGTKVELKHETSEGTASLLFEEMLREKLGNGLIVNELRSSASKVFDRKRREERVFEVNLAVNSSVTTFA